MVPAPPRPPAGAGTRARRSVLDHHLRPVGDEVVDQLDVLVPHADAARRRFLADARGVVGAVDPEAGEVLRLLEPEPARTEDVARVAGGDGRDAGPPPGRVLLADADD